MRGAGGGEVVVRDGRFVGLPMLFFSSVAILLLALALSGGLTIGALRAVHHEATAAAVRMVGSEWALRIQGAIRFGKPITQFHGLAEILAEIRHDLESAALVAVTLPDGRVVGAHGADGPAERRALATAVRDVLGAGGQARSTDGRHHFVFPVRARDGSAAGALTVVVEAASLATGFSHHLRTNVELLLLMAGAGSIAMLAGLAILAPLRPGRPFSLVRLQALPIAVLLATQVLYGWQAVPMFRQQYLKSTAHTAEIVAERLERDLERLFAKGVPVARLAGIEAPFLRIMAEMPEIGFMEVQDAGRAVLHRVHRDGRVEAGAAPLAVDPHHDVTAGLDRMVGGAGERLGTLRVHLSEQAIAAGVQQRVLDAGTVMLTSALFVVELLILMAVLLRPEALGGRGAPDGNGRHMLARPGAFLLLFAWALPLSFIPLRLREIHQPVPGLPEHVVLALPISAEMLCALITAIIAGGMVDRRGWHVPFLGGVALCIAGSLFSAAAADAWAFVAARAVVGLGYGLAWMGIQGFIFEWTPAPSRARGLANLVAGIFAGHICGSAVGAMLAQQTDYTTVFAVSALVMAAPALFAALFMRAYMHRPPAGDGASKAAGGGFDLAGVRPLLADRSFLALLLGSVVPFSVAQVGLLYYTLPVHLSAQGVSQSNIGRILMLYGLSVIYLGPLVGRHIDRYGRKIAFIALGGVVGGGGMALLCLDDGVAAVTLAVFLLGLAGALSGAAQSAFALDLPVVRRQGAGKAMGIQRAADKLGQMLGPLLVGGLFAAIGVRYGLAFTGLYYMAATVAFAIIVRTRPKKVSAGTG